MDLMMSTPNPIGSDDLLLVSAATEPPKSLSPILSREVSNMFRLVNFGVLCSLIALFGIVTNVMNMMVFYRQGFNTNTNISFFALSISDMMCLVTAELYDICLNPYLDTDDIPYIFKEIQYLALAWWHLQSSRITSWITVFITAERCLGVALPLKIKQVITLRRTTAVMCLIYSFNLLIILPEYSIAYLDWKFDPAKNRTVFGLLYRSTSGSIYGLVYSLTSTSGIMSFIFVILLTTFLVINLGRKSKWRKNATGGSDNSETVSSRDKRTMKMIVMIATVLIICYTPGAVLSVAAAFVPDFMIGRAYENLFFSVWSIAFIFTVTNSSINVFVYYRMSTKYRLTFNELFFTSEQSIRRLPAE